MRSPPFCLSARALIGQGEPYSPFVRGRVRQLTFEGSAYKIRHRQKDDVAMAFLWSELTPSEAPPGLPRHRQQLGRTSAPPVPMRGETTVSGNLEYK